MNSDKEPIDAENVQTPHNVADQEPHSFAKCCPARNILWKSSSEKETFPTVVVNYHYDLKRRSTGAIPKRREAWSQMIAAMHAKKLINSKNTKKAKDESVYNLRKLYEVSKEELESGKSNTSSGLCDTNKIAKVSSRNSNDGSRQSLKVEIFNIASKQEAKSEDPPKIQTSKSSNISTYDSCDSDICRQLKASKCKTNVSRNSIKVEIFNFPPLQEVVTEENKTPTVTQILQHEPEIIVISDDSDENLVYKTAIGPEQKPKSVNSLQNLIEAAQNTSDYCNISKSTQKPETLAEIPTQTAFGTKLLENILQMPLLSKSSASKPPPSKYGISSMRQRQSELHRMRVQVEQKRLELLDMKLTRERDHMDREKLLFENGLKMKTFEFQQLSDEKDI